MAETEVALKKKLQQFLAEMFKMGTVRGFQHFSAYLRGKEEMALQVFHEPQHSSRRCSFISTPFPDISTADSFSSSCLPYDQRSLMLSQGTQMALSGLGDKGVGLPPASPSDNEQDSSNPLNATLFLIAGYSRYSCPYVWVRSNHKRLIAMSGAGDEEKDNPLRLKSTLRWKDAEVYIWDVIAELVKLCMYPAPRNPFAVNMNYFHALSPQQQVLSTGAMMSCLQKIILHTADDRQHAGKVLEDLHLISRLHYSALKSLVKNHQLPILEDYLQRQKASQQAQQKRGVFTQSRVRYPSSELSPYFSQHSGSGSLSVQSTQGVYTPQGSAERGFPGYGFTPAPSLF